MAQNASYHLASYDVRDVRFGPITTFSNGLLMINREELEGVLLESSLFADVDIELVAPGDDVRVVHIMDACEPRIRVDEPGTDFPGVVGPILPVGTGTSNRLNGISVIETLEPLPGEPTHWREAILDMSGPGARYSPFSELRNVVVSFRPAPGLFDGAAADGSLYNTFEGTPEVIRFKNEVRAAGIKAGIYLARATGGITPDWIDSFEAPGRRAEGLPKMIYLYQLQGPLFYGEVLPRAGAMTAAAHLPLYVNPAEVLDGAMVSMSSLTACKRELTYLIQNHAVIMEMYRRHGEEIDFRGVILCSNGDSVSSKQRIATVAAGVARYIGADGAVLNYLGGGHAAVDVMVTCRELEKQGVRTVLLMMEMSSQPGESGFVDFVEEADAIVSTGNYEETVHLPGVARAIGGKEILVLGDEATGALDIALRHMLAATSQFGAWTLRGAENEHSW